MNGPLEFPFARAAAALRGYRTNMIRAARWMHPSWPAALLDLNAAQYAQWSRAVQASSDARLAGASLALCASTGVDAPPFEWFAQPIVSHRSDGRMLNAVLLDASPIDVGLQVLRMRSLSFRRGEARRLIDKRTRAQLSSWAGVAVEKLCIDAHLKEAPNIARLHMQIDVPLLTALDETTLAAEGWWLIQRDVGGRLPAPDLLRRALPRLLPEPAWIGRLPPDIDAQGTARLFVRLSTLLPECAWLFG